MLYVREPGTDFFVEMDGGGFGSSHGDMMEAFGKNAFLEPYYAKFTVYSHDVFAKRKPPSLGALAGGGIFAFAKAKKFLCIFIWTKL